jgi:aspartate aminotransferase
MISKSMQPFLAGSSAIRAMFEEGKRMAKERGAENVYDYSVGNPSPHPPIEVHKALDYINSKADPHMVYSYPSNAGYESTRQAVADNLNERFGDYFDMSGIIMTAGAGYAINIIMKCILDPGDKVVAFAPYFVEYANWARNFFADTLVVPPNYKGGFEPDAKKLKEILEPDVKAVIINNPNNPTGAIYSRESLEAVAEVLREAEKEFGHPIYIISDEPYREIVFDGVDSPFIASHYNNTITCYSFSKSLSLPGERIGYIAVNPACEDSALLVDMFGQISRGIGHNCPPSIIQLAVAKSLYDTADLTVYETNKNILYTELTKMGFDIVEPGGTFYMFPKALEDDAIAFSNKAKELDLLLVPSNSFGVPGHFRISYCIPTEKVERSIPVFQKLADLYL